MGITDTLNLSAYPFYQWDSLIAAQPQEDTMAIGCTGVPVDSIFRMRELPETVYRKSMFTHHNMPVQHDSLIPRENPAPPAWLFAVLVILTALLCLYLRQRKLTIKDLAQSLVDHRAMDRNLRNNNLTHSAMLTPMGLLVSVAMALAIHTVALAHTGFVGFLLLSLALIAAYMTRNGIIRLLGNIFDNRAGVNIDITSNYLYHLALAIIIVPLLYPMAYAHWGDGIIYAIGGITAVEFFMRLYNGINLFLKQSKNFHFHLFYYLCAVELIPFLVLIKLFIS